MPFEPTHSRIQPFLRPLIFLLSTVGCFVIWSGHPYITITKIEPVLKPEVAIIFVCYFCWKLLLRHSGFLKNPTVVLTRGWPIETMWSALMHQCFTLFLWFMALRESRQSKMLLFDWFSTRPRSHELHDLVTPLSSSPNLHLVHSLAPLEAEYQPFGQSRHPHPLT